MSLLDIKNYLVNAKMASLQTLCTYFNCDSELLRQMLDHFVKKGKVRRFSQQLMCGGKCTQCGSCATEIYEWVTV